MNIQNTVTLGNHTYTVTSADDTANASNVQAAIASTIESLQANADSEITDALLTSLQNSVSAQYQTSITITVEDAQQCENNLQNIVDQMPLDVNAMMAMFQRLSQEMRNANRQIRASELDAQVSDLLGAANKMETAAIYRLAAGCVQGGMQIASGAIQVGGAFKAGYDLKKSQPDTAAATDTSTTGSGAAAANSTASAIPPDKAFDLTMARTKAASDITGGVSEVASSLLKFGADSADVEAKRMEATARLHESASSEANEMMQQMLEVIRDVRDKISTIQQASIETNRGIARNV